MCERWCVCVCQSGVSKMVCERGYGLSKMVCERWSVTVRERWCVTKWCMKNGV